MKNQWSGLLLLGVLCTQMGWAHEIRTAPLALLARWYTLEALYRADANWAFGPSLVHFGADAQGNMFLPSVRGNALGAVVNYYFESGWYGGLRYQYMNFDSYSHGNNDEIHKKGNALTTLGGFRSSFAESFYWMMGAGLQAGVLEKRTYNRITGVVSTDPSESVWAPYLEFKVGVEF